MLLQIVATIVELIAVYGAGLVSTMYSYEPEIPEELK